MEVMTMNNNEKTNDWTLDYYYDDEQHLDDFEAVLEIMDIYNEYVATVHRMSRFAGRSVRLVKEVE